MNEVYAFYSQFLRKYSATNTSFLLLETTSHCAIDTFPDGYTPRCTATTLFGRLGYRPSSGSTTPTASSTRIILFRWIRVSGTCSVVTRLVDFQNMQGQTALAAATERGHVAIVEELVRAEANPNIGDHTGKTRCTWPASGETQF
ncbi:uncharacterized protein BP01DRAFT_378588 [Aspergillus saccharolyticus JOP 1030-1]|uniref:Uncharacterized protein n=1 Tax=Aspergillus saccharolyticus JOP 1030-1 TaxID=1450539 RepID=A0A319AER2_9EURO|nr:hypothetical protein BP01DRAFT_378588 [Aspergillus saccharolyticus JOP 1030-1]PYH49978.1 hypothetical protein BP01DRAFT_378588 [Aspergillus saccharolyticus JOP 1030-1]